MDMSRIRIEGLLAAFPKLVGSGKQHTYVETENVRYVYQPIEVSRCCLLIDLCPLNLVVKYLSPCRCFCEAADESSSLQQLLKQGWGFRL
jgi:hypothetical protein